MSWGNGSRWGNDSEAFMDEQVFWSLLSWFVAVPANILVLLEILINT